MAAWYDSENLTLRQAVDIPPIWLLGFLVAARGMAEVVPAATLSFPAARVIGAVLVVAGVGLMFWAIAAFRTHRTSVVPHQMPKRLITTGPFALSRNPIYLGDVLVLAGAVCWWGAWPALVLIPAFMAVIGRRFIAPEEARMKDHFATEFAEFATKTRRWL